MTISISTPTSNTGSIQNNSTDVLTIGSDNSVSIDTNTLHINATNNRVGIGTTTPSRELHVVAGNDNLVRIQGGVSNAKGIEMYDGSTVGAQIYSVSSDLRFFANSTERMRIDSDGYVTEPNKPMVFAVSAPATSSSPGSPVILKYANAAYNPGNHYNPATGNFTCPVTGRYKVTQHCMVDANLSVYPLDISITKNGGGVTTGYTSNTTYNINTCAAIINCAANDTLAITLNYGGKHAGYDSFTVEFLG